MYITSNYVYIIMNISITYDMNEEQALHTHITTSSTSSSSVKFFSFNFFVWQVGK